MGIFFKFLKKRNECNQEKFALIGVEICYVIIIKQYDSRAEIVKQINKIKETSRYVSKYVLEFTQ